MYPSIKSSSGIKFRYTQLNQKTQWQLKNENLKTLIEEVKNYCAVQKELGKHDKFQQAIHALMGLAEFPDDCTFTNVTKDELKILCDLIRTNRIQSSTYSPFFTQIRKISIIDELVDLARSTGAHIESEEKTLNKLDGLLELLSSEQMELIGEAEKFLNLPKLDDNEKYVVHNIVLKNELSNISGSTKAEISRLDRKINNLAKKLDKEIAIIDKKLNAIKIELSRIEKGYIRLHPSKVAQTIANLEQYEVNLKAQKKYFIENHTTRTQQLKGLISEKTVEIDLIDKEEPFDNHEDNKSYKKHLNQIKKHMESSAISRFEKLLTPINYETKSIIADNLKGSTARMILDDVVLSGKIILADNLKGSTARMILAGVQSGKIILTEPAAKKLANALNMENNLLIEIENFPDNISHKTEKIIAFQANEKLADILEYIQRTATYHETTVPLVFNNYSIHGELSNNKTADVLIRRELQSVGAIFIEGNKHDSFEVASQFLTDKDTEMASSYGAFAADQFSSNHEIWKSHERNCFQSISYYIESTFTESKVEQLENEIQVHLPRTFEDVFSMPPEDTIFQQCEKEFHRASGVKLNIDNSKPILITDIIHFENGVFSLNPVYSELQNNIPNDTINIIKFIPLLVDQTYLNMVGNILLPTLISSFSKDFELNEQNSFSKYSEAIYDLTTLNSDNKTTTINMKYIYKNVRSLEIFEIDSKLTFDNALLTKCIEKDYKTHDYALKAFEISNFKFSKISFQDKKLSVIEINNSKQNYEKIEESIVQIDNPIYNNQQVDSKQKTIELSKQIKDLEELEIKTKIEITQLDNLKKEYKNITTLIDENNFQDSRIPVDNSSKKIIEIVTREEIDTLNSEPQPLIETYNLPNADVEKRNREKTNKLKNIGSTTTEETKSAPSSPIISRKFSKNPIKRTNSAEI